jgi:hypothetical protein
MQQFMPAQAPVLGQGIRPTGLDGPNDTRATALPGTPGHAATNVIDQQGGLDPRGQTVDGNNATGVLPVRVTSEHRFSEHSEPYRKTLNGWYILQYRIQRLSRTEPGLSGVQLPPEELCHQSNTIVSSELTSQQNGAISLKRSLRRNDRKMFPRKRRWLTIDRKAVYVQY